MTFSEYLRDLRKQSGLSQRILAEMVEVDFTYLSKIENARVPAPSENTLRRLAKALADRLNLDETELSDELITLAGKIPSDLAQTLSRNPHVIRMLRSVGSDVRSAQDWRRIFAEEDK